MCSHGWSLMLAWSCGEALVGELHLRKDPPGAERLVFHTPSVSHLAAVCSSPQRRNSLEPLEPTLTASGGDLGGMSGASTQAGAREEKLKLPWAGPES